jgi:SAM-dependent methyltransferase
MTDSFYRAFEDKYRGSRELIKSRLQVYLPFIKPLLNKKKQTKPKVLDLGCGRGEWLELLTEQGFIAQGVDIDEGMLEACWELDLKVEKADALDYLKALKANSIAIISGFHIAEHIPFEMLQELVDQVLRILKPGGLLILETPNPENIVVGTANFYLDPTHKQPLPPLLLSFIAEHAGYARVKILRLQEPEGLQESQNLTLIDVLSGVSPDYSIVAQKAAAKSTLKKFDAAFSKEYGVKLDEIANLYDGQLKSKTDDLKTKWSDEHQRAEQLAVELSATREQKAAAEAVKEQLVQNIQSMEQRIEVANREKAELKTEYRTDLNREHQRAEQLAVELSATGTENKHKIDKLHVSLIDSKEQQQTLLQEIGQQRLQLETQVQALHQKETQFDDQLSKKEDAINWLNNEWDAAKHKIDELHQSSQHWWSMADQQSKELEEVRNKSDELNHSSHHWWLEADRLSKELQTLYNSKSWRITWPLRKLMQFLSWLFSMPIRISLWLVRLPKRTARWLLVKSMSYALKRSGLKLRARALVYNFPKLERKLRRLAQARGLTTVQPASTAQPVAELVESNPSDNKNSETTVTVAELSHLTPNARRIYAELVAAMTQNKKEKG